MAPTSTMTERMSTPNLAEQWIKSINIWDPQWDYVMHDSHWLTSEWSATCEKCLANGQKNINGSTKDITVTKNTTVPLPQQTLPEFPLIPMTPIAPPLLSKNRVFVTPHTTTKYHSDTFTRSTRASTKRAPQNHAVAESEHDLITLNETFDLYKSALAETPDAEEAVESRDSCPITSRIPRRGIK